MARKKEAEKPENHERWLVSWADFMTLMFALFVTLYSNALGASASSATQAKMEQLSESIKSAFEKMGIFDEGTGHSPLNSGIGPGKEPIWISQPTIVNLPSPPPQGPSTDFPMPGMAKIEPMMETKPDNAIAESDAELFNELRNQLGAELSEGKIQMRPDKRGVTITLGEALFFASGSDVLQPSAIPIINRIAEKLKQVNKPGLALSIEGHTDDQKVSGANRFRDNWELSFFRAKAVLAYIQSQNIFPPDNLNVAGYAEFHPVAPNTTAEGRARNRRVDLVIMTSNVKKTGGVPPTPR